MKAATLCAYRRCRTQHHISIHAAREGGDAIVHTDKTCNDKFQSTPPVKAATQPSRADQLAELISIHAAREGGDPRALTYNTRFEISIHAAREGGDGRICIPRGIRDISIHAAREGGDDKNQSSRTNMRHFNPRRP